MSKTVEIDDKLVEFFIERTGDRQYLAIRLRPEINHWCLDSLTAPVELRCGNLRVIGDEIIFGINPNPVTLGYMARTAPLSTVHGKHELRFDNPNDYTLFRLRWL